MRTSRWSRPYRCAGGYHHREGDQRGSKRRFISKHPRAIVACSTHHGNTSSLGPVVSLGLGSEEGSTGLEQRLVNSTTTGDDTDGSSGVGSDSLLGSGRQSDSGLSVVDRVTNDGGVVTRSSGQRSSVSDLLLDVADDGTFGAGRDRQNVTDVQGGLLSAVDERSGGKTFGGDEGLGSLLVSVRVSEENGSQGSTSTGVVDDVLDDTSDVTVSLGEVEGPQSSRVLPVVGVGLEDTTALSLVSDDSLLKGRHSRLALALPSRYERVGCPQLLHPRRLLFNPSHSCILPSYHPMLRLPVFIPSTQQLANNPFPFAIRPRVPATYTHFEMSLLLLWCRKGLDGERVGSVRRAFLTSGVVVDNVNVDDVAGGDGSAGRAETLGTPASQRRRVLRD